MWSQASQIVAVRAGRLFDPKSDQLLTNQVVLIRGERIEQVGPANRVEIPRETKIIDLSRATVRPGLIDTHLHVFVAPGGGGTLNESLQYRTLVALANAQKDLNSGFTTICDLESEGALYGTVDLRNAINSGLVQGPRMQVAARGVHATGQGTGGLPPNITPPPDHLITDSPWAGRQAVREEFMYGVDWIKIFGTYQFSFNQTAAW